MKNLKNEIKIEANKYIAHAVNNLRFAKELSVGALVDSLRVGYNFTQNHRATSIATGVAITLLPVTACLAIGDPNPVVDTIALMGGMFAGTFFVAEGLVGDPYSVVEVNKTNVQEAIREKREVKNDIEFQAKFLHEIENGEIVIEPGVEIPKTFSRENMETIRFERGYAVGKSLLKDDPKLIEEWQQLREKEKGYRFIDGRVPYLAEALRLNESGASFEEVDKALCEMANATRSEYTKMNYERHDLNWRYTETSYAYSLMTFLKFTTTNNNLDKIEENVLRALDGLYSNGDRYPLEESKKFIQEARERCKKYDKEMPPESVQAEDVPTEVKAYELESPNQE